MTKTGLRLPNIVSSEPSRENGPRLALPGFRAFSGRFRAFGTTFASLPSSASTTPEPTDLVMFDTESAKYEENDMDLTSIEAANFDVMVAEEAILDWLVNLESDDTDYEMSESDEFVQEKRLAN
ncbi:MAG: hypothetical protein ACNS61_04085 [Candidatus Wenzhouxiangella sp. M2_3B_020]